MRASIIAVAVAGTVAASCHTPPTTTPRPSPDAAADPGGSDRFWQRMQRWQPASALEVAPDTHRPLAMAFATHLSGDLARALDGYRSLLDSDDGDVGAAAGFLFANVGVYLERHALVLESLPAQDTGTATLTLLGAFAKKPAMTVAVADAPSHAPYRASRTGTPIVEVVINGVPRSLWLDTGSALTVLSERAAEACGVDRLTAAATTSGTSTSSTIEAGPASVAEFQFQAARLQHVGALIVSDASLTIGAEGEQIEIDGLRGWNVLRHLNVAIDPHRSQIQVSNRSLCGQGARNLHWLLHPVVEARVDQTVVMFMLDTGAQWTEFSSAGRLADETRADGAVARTIHGAGGSEAASLRTVVDLSLKIGGQPFSPTQVLVRTLPDYGFARVDGRLGQDLVARETVRLCGPTGRISFGELPGLPIGG